MRRNVTLLLVGLRANAVMCKNSFCLIILSYFVWGSLALNPSWADDFPGKGDRFAWSNALPYYNLANKYLEHGRYEEAKTNFEEAIYRYEYDPDFYVNYGVALRKLESYAAAEEAFKKAIQLRGNDWQTWSNLANAYLKQNRLKETIACFQKAMKMTPPPPPQEKEAMLKDIADINKILSMQAPPPGQSQQADKSANGKDTKEGKKVRTLAAANKKQSGSRGNSLAANSAQKTEDNEKSSDRRATFDPPAPAPGAEKQSINKSGWDWVQ